MPPDPEDEESGHHSDEKNPALRAGREDKRKQPDNGGTREHADVHARLQDRGQPRPPRARPCFRQERRPDGPLTADSKRRHKAEQHQLPPRLRKRAESGAAGIRQHRERESAAPSEKITQSPEERTTERPTDEEGGLDVRALFLHG